MLERALLSDLDDEKGVDDVKEIGVDDVYRALYGNHDEEKETFTVSDEGRVLDSEDEEWRNGTLPVVSPLKVTSGPADVKARMLATLMEGAQSGALLNALQENHVNKASNSDPVPGIGHVH